MKRVEKIIKENLKPLTGLKDSYRYITDTKVLIEKIRKGEIDVR